MARLPSRNFQAMDGGKAISSRRYLLAVSVITTIILAFSLGYILGKRTAQNVGTQEATNLEVETMVEPRVELLRPPPEGAKTQELTSPVANTQAIGPLPLTSTSSVGSSPEHASPSGEGVAAHQRSSEKGSLLPSPVKPKEVRFTIQVGSFQDRESAERLALELESLGYDAYVEKAVIPHRGVWYRVRVGNFATKEEAKAWADRNLEKMGRKGYPTTRSIP